MYFILRVESIIWIVIKFRLCFILYFRNLLWFLLNFFYFWFICGFNLNLLLSFLSDHPLFPEFLIYFHEVSLHNFGRILCKPLHFLPCAIFPSNPLDKKKYFPLRSIWFNFMIKYSFYFIEFLLILCHFLLFFALLFLLSLIQVFFLIVLLLKSIVDNSTWLFAFRWNFIWRFKILFYLLVRSIRGIFFRLVIMQVAIYTFCNRTDRLRKFLILVILVFNVHWVSVATVNWALTCASLYLESLWFSLRLNFFIVTWVCIRIFHTFLLGL